MAGEKNGTAYYCRRGWAAPLLAAASLFAVVAAPTTARLLHSAASTRSTASPPPSSLTVAAARHDGGGGGGDDDDDNDDDSEWLVAALRLNGTKLHCYDLTFAYCAKEMCVPNDDGLTASCGCVEVCVMELSPRRTPWDPRVLAPSHPQLRSLCAARRIRGTPPSSVRNTYRVHRASPTQPPPPPRAR